MAYSHERGYYALGERIAEHDEVASNVFSLGNIARADRVDRRISKQHYGNYG